MHSHLEEFNKMNRFSELAQVKQLSSVSPEQNSQF